MRVDLQKQAQMAFVKANEEMEVDLELMARLVTDLAPVCLAFSHSQLRGNVLSENFAEGRIRRG